MPVSLAEIARNCGVSTSTVSLALRDHPRIPAKTRDQIKRAAQQLGYKPNRSVSRVMSEIRSAGQVRAYKETLGYITADLASNSRNYESKLYAGASARAAEVGYGLDRFELGVEGLNLPQLGKVLASRGIRGLIIAPWPEAHTEIHLDWDRFASVAIGYSLEQPEMHRVARDVMHTLRAVYQQLQARGYRRIGFVMERGHEERMEYTTLAAFQLNAFLIPENERVPALVEKQLRKETFHVWLEQHQPDVIVTMIHVVEEWLLEAKRRVPGDVGLFVFNCLSPQFRLSGIYPAYEAIGAAAVEQVAALVERGGFGIPQRATTLLVPGIECPGTTLRPS